MTNSRQAPTLRTARIAALKGTALALVVAAGLAGATVLSTSTSPVAAAQNSVVSQVLTTTTFSELAAKVRPAVVSVQVRRGGKGDDSAPETSERGRSMEEFFKRFFNNPDDARRFGRRFGGGPNQQHRRRRSSAQGSGFVISPEGHVVTNHHVVADAQKIVVVMDDGKEYTAELIGSDPRSDLAVLKIKSDKKFPTVKFSQSQSRVGDWVMAVGNPFGLGGSVSTGIVSARGREIGSGPYDYIQIDAAVNKGNSGGPAFNLAGEVVGVNTAIFSPNGGSVGVGFAIPAALVRNVVGEILDKGKVTRGWLGVAIQTVTPDIAQSLGLDEARGALVSETTQNGPADDAGVKPGDTILQVNDSKIDSTRDLARKIARLDPGATAQVLVLRDGVEKTITVEIGTLPSREKLAKRMQRDEWQPTYSSLGLGVAPAREVEGDANARGLVITRVKPGSEADEKGLRTGDRILNVAGTDVDSPSALERVLNAASKSGQEAVLVQVRSRNSNRFVALQLDKT
ncbi:MAG: Do family serine endopeptidase [Alphaproteobacteria bacterium]